MIKDYSTALILGQWITILITGVILYIVSIY